MTARGDASSCTTIRTYTRLAKWQDSQAYQQTGRKTKWVSLVDTSVQVGTVAQQPRRQGYAHSALSQHQHQHQHFGLSHLRPWLARGLLYRPLLSTAPKRSSRFRRGMRTCVKRIAPLSTPLSPTCEWVGVSVRQGNWGEGSQLWLTRGVAKAHVIVVNHSA